MPGMFYLAYIFKLVIYSFYDTSFTQHDLIMYGH